MRRMSTGDWTEDLTSAASSAWTSLETAASSAWNQAEESAESAYDSAQAVVESAWESASRGWLEVQARWNAEVAGLYKEAQDLWADVILADPTGYVARVNQFVAELEGSRVSLDKLGEREGEMTPAERERYRALSQEYNTLAAGFWSDAVADSAQVEPTLGFVPVLLAAAPYLGTLAVGLAAACWSVAAYEYAVGLREDTALAERELTARVEASKEGRLLQPSTLPPAPDIEGGMSKLLVGGLALAGVAIVVPMIFKR